MLNFCDCGIAPARDEPQVIGLCTERQSPEISFLFLEKGGGERANGVLHSPPERDIRGQRRRREKKTPDFTTSMIEASIRTS